MIIPICYFQKHETEMAGFVDKVAKALQNRHVDLTKAIINTVLGSKGWLL